MVSCTKLKRSDQTFLWNFISLGRTDTIGMIAMTMIVDHLTVEIVVEEAEEVIVELPPKTLTEFNP